MDHPSLRIKRVHLAMRKALERYLEPVGLTVAQFDVGQQLMLEDGLEHRVLQERLGIASPTLTHIIDGMVAQGLVERRLSPEDARVRRLYVTPKARALNARLGELGALFERQMFAGFSTHEAELLLSWLDRVADNLERQPLQA